MRQKFLAIACAALLAIGGLSVSAAPAEEVACCDCSMCQVDCTACCGDDCPSCCGSGSCCE